MLSHEDNEKLVRVGPGSVMGELFRHYWLPIFGSADLEKNGQPQTVKILGETMVIFRDSEGNVGLVDNVCPHRGAPMLFGRNEDCGLRCVYHGWKFDVDGNVVDMPAEPVRSRLKERVKIKSYPCVERNGVVWTYMGKEGESDRPPLPNFEWNMVPDENVVITFRVQECNWLQALEGEIDSAHAPILHGRIDEGGSINQWVAKRDLRPVFECVRQDFGMSIASRRVIDDEHYYWRVNQFVMPFYSLVPPQSNEFYELSGHAWVPIDDENTLCLMFSYRPNEALHPKSRPVFLEGFRGRETGHHSVHGYEDQGPAVPYGRYTSKYRRETGYHFDYELQKTTWFSGLPGLWVQDAACQSGVARVYDRSKENLCTSDTGIAMTRRMLLETAGAFAEKGEKPERYNDPDLYMVRAISLTLPKNQPWADAGAEHMRAELGKGFGYELVA
ncbi:MULTISPECIES: Rieske 2Fe-2S domain-containing protein [Alphaproteobacteria]|uniref:Ring-hydroxylating oxygenase subunit alpha n=2 Tax=Alphaproteobacteria TaxID=28211 RepID=A0A512HNM3_9HYPH|nr:MULTISPECIES: Rieske 2Fe-2S domain-containing protein [Alphaproteobacteria]GEO87052.1 ring-hydroxylating oxygenase subunit alpha [Ciceribacter naphthalenivorans]GLR23162.1 ring-hydroxylating oxygenase subunit alpha [Ciceribacter naphthalenivorans]GLT06018.1 ring-hydroxylating oxygenase subunit alpha [Sphingomonas psychrolutea]